MDCDIDYYMNNDTCYPCNQVNPLCISCTNAMNCSQCQIGWTGANCSKCDVGYTNASCNDCIEGYEKNDTRCQVKKVVVIAAVAVEAT